MENTGDTGDIMANTANILAQCRNEADTSLAEAGRNSAAPDREHIETGAAVNGAAVTGAAVNGAAATGTAVSGAAATGAAVARIGTPLGAGAFLMRLTTVIILMGITLRIGTHLVIPTTGVGVILMRIRTIILRIGILMTTAPYQGSDSIIADPPVILFKRVTTL
jgi:hypothetical protein